VSNVVRLRGKWAPGQSANPGGFSSEQRQQLRELQKLAGKNAARYLSEAESLAFDKGTPPNVRATLLLSLLDRVGFRPGSGLEQSVTQNLHELSDEELHAIAASSSAPAAEPQEGA